MKLLLRKQNNEFLPTSSEVQVVFNKKLDKTVRDSSNNHGLIEGKCNLIIHFDAVVARYKRKHELTNMSSEEALKAENKHCIP